MSTEMLSPSGAFSSRFTRRPWAATNGDVSRYPLGLKCFDLRAHSRMKDRVIKMGKAWFRISAKVDDERRRKEQLKILTSALLSSRGPRQNLIAQTLLKIDFNERTYIGGLHETASRYDHHFFDCPSRYFVDCPVTRAVVLDWAVGRRDRQANSNRAKDRYAAGPKVAESFFP